MSMSNVRYLFWFRNEEGLPKRVGKSLLHALSVLVDEGMRSGQRDLLVERKFRKASSKKKPSTAEETRSRTGRKTLHTKIPEVYERT